MTVPAPEGENVAPSFTDADLISNIKSVFGESLKATDLMHREELFASFVNLTGIYVSKTCPDLITELSFDYAAVQSMFARFQRDAYGVATFHDLIGQAVQDKEIHPSAAARILAHLPKMGIRINTDSPRKTKIAAAFSLWMSVFRPVHLKSLAYSGISREQHGSFCASLNFWMCTMYLAMFGSVALSSDADGKTRIERVKHDLTYRALNLSSLEMLYCSVYRPKVA